MRILLVNNTERPPTLLEETFSREELAVLSWDNLRTVVMKDFDFAVLSGSSNFPIVGNETEMSTELELIRSSTIPILGICYGFELIVVAFGGILKSMSHKEQGVLQMTIIKPDPIFKGIEELFVYEGHAWGADVLPDSLVPLATSAHGIEAVKHKDRLIYGFQFHPEKLQRETAGGRILENFVSLARQHFAKVRSEEYVLGRD